MTSIRRFNVLFDLVTIFFAQLVSFLFGILRTIIEQPMAT